MKKVLLFLSLIAVLFVVAACGADSDSDAAANETEGQSGEEVESSEGATEDEEQPAEVVVEHELGETKVKKNPETVVVFDFGVLDSLDKLGVAVAGVPQASVPSYLSKYEAEEYKNVGSLKEPDFETIYGLKPDLIIISGRQASLYEEFKEIAPTIFMGVDTSNYMDSFKNNVTLLGEIFGKEDEVKEELEAVEETIQSIRNLAAAEDIKGLVVLTTGGKVSAYGPGSRFGIIHDEFGIAPVDESIDVSTHGMSVSFEYILQQNPEYLFVIDRDAVVEEGAETAKNVIENDLVKNTNAYKNGNIVYLDPNYWYLSGGGLVSVSEMANEIKAGLE